MRDNNILGVLGVKQFLETRIAQVEARYNEMSESEQRAHRAQVSEFKNIVIEIDKHMRK